MKAIVLDLTRQEIAVACRFEEGVTDWKQRESSGRSALVRAAQEMGARVLTPPPLDEPQDRS